MSKKYGWSSLWLLYVAVVFGNSLVPAVQSSEQSAFVLGKVLEVMGAVGMNHTGITEHIIRKTAHFTEYAVMGLLLYQVLSQYRLPKTERWLLHGLLGFLVPFVDETIQLFVAGRSGQISDMWLDCFGVLCGTAVWMGILWLLKKRRQRRESKHEEKL